MEPLAALMLIMGIVNKSVPILTPQILNIVRAVKGLTSEQKMTLIEFYDSIDMSRDIPRPAYEGREDERPV